MNIDIKIVPFSAPGSYLCVSDLTPEIWKKNSDVFGLALRTARGGHHSRNGILGRIVPMKDGQEVLFTYEATPWDVAIRAEGGEIRIAVDEGGQMRFKGRGLQLKLDFMTGTFDEFLQYSKDRWYLAAFKYESKLLITRLSGEIELEDPGLEARNQHKAAIFSGGEWEAKVEEFCVVYDERPTKPTFEECVASAKASFEEYAAKACKGSPERFYEAVRQAAYVNYSAQVGPDGLLEGKVMLMSKNWMNSVWTWDCQFNAVETALYDSDASWDNFASPFRRQYASGMLLDMVSDHAYSDTYTKPPVHGWALSHLRKDGVLTGERLRIAYEWLLKWAHSWYKYMDWDHDGVCQYNHGNDSGWDNCTYFLCGAPIEGPDLSAYLVLCWDELAEMAQLLGMPEKSAEYRARSEEQLKALLEHSWDGEKFRVYQSGTHNEKTDCDSLLPFLPIVLGNRLPKDVFDKLTTGLKQEGRFLTPFGLATESVDSKYYVSDGYWRGPIWAPAMMFIIFGLHRGGEEDFAAELAERFCCNCAKQGFSENFDATTGAGLRDRAYTWCSSVFMILAKNYVKPE
jgi:putative isomerase